MRDKSIANDTDHSLYSVRDPDGKTETKELLKKFFCKVIPERLLSSGVKCIDMRSKALGMKKR